MPVMVGIKFVMPSVGLTLTSYSSRQWVLPSLQPVLCPALSKPASGCQPPPGSASHHAGSNRWLPGGWYSTAD